MGRKYKNVLLNEDEYQIYARQLSLSSIQLQGQKRLKEAKVLCVGAGGLGSIALLYLAAAGVGLIGIIDDDTVDLSNLHRQVIYTSTDVGKYKAESAARHLCALHRHVSINTYTEKLTSQNGYSIIKEYDIIMDCTDSFTAKNTVSYICKKLHKIHVYAAIASFTGQASVFNYRGGPSYNEVYTKDLTKSDRSCTTNGVLGILPGMMGMIQATETIKIITGIGNVLSGYIIKYSALNMSMQKIKIRQSVSIDKDKYDLKNYTRTYCVTIPGVITLVQLNNMYSNNVPTYLVDIRNFNEYRVAHLSGAVNIPLSLIRNVKILQLLKIKSLTNSLIIYCNSSVKSNIASAILNDASILHLRLNIT